MDWNGIFNPENSFWTFMGKLYDLLILWLLWLLCSLPVVTIGASTAALLQFALKQADDSEGRVFRSFLKAFRESFLPATVLFLALLGGAAFLAFDFYILTRPAFPPGARTPVLAVLVSLSFVFCVTSAYAFPLLARYKIGAGKALRDALAIGFKHLPSTILILLVRGLFVWLSLRTPYFVLAFAVIALAVNSRLLRHVMDRCGLSGAEAGT